VGNYGKNVELVDLKVRLLRRSRRHRRRLPEHVPAVPPQRLASHTP